MSDSDTTIEPPISGLDTDFDSESTEDLMDEAMTMAQQIADNAPLAVQTFKELAYRGLNMSNQDISALTYQMYDALLLTEDSQEGPKAFAEKRKPQWKGR